MVPVDPVCPKVADEQLLHDDSIPTSNPKPLVSNPTGYGFESSTRQSPNERAFRGMQKLVQEFTDILG